MGSEQEGYSFRGGMNGNETDSEREVTKLLREWSILGRWLPEWTILILKCGLF